MGELRRTCLPIAIVFLLASCAGTHGDPESVQKRLKDKYAGKPIEEVVQDLGAPDPSFRLPDGRIAYTWRRQTNKYWSNVLIKSDERCVVTMITDQAGQKIESIGKVDDSLGGWQISYCAEQLGL
jgi:hypothetical protein